MSDINGVGEVKSLRLFPRTTGVGSHAGNSKIKSGIDPETKKTKENI